MEFDGTTASEVQVQIIDAFNDAGDAFNQFTYLLQLASEFPELPAERKVEQALVKGCQSQVWLYTSVVDDGAGVPAMHIEGDSDTLMVRGVIRIYVLMFEGRPPKKCWTRQSTSSARPSSRASSTTNAKPGQAPFTDASRRRRATMWGRSERR